jgi:hypothetical protein
MISSRFEPGPTEQKSDRITLSWLTDWPTDRTIDWITNKLSNEVTNELTKSIEKIPFVKLARSSATQEIDHIAWDSNVHYRVHNSSQPVPILSQVNYTSRPPILLLSTPIYDKIFQVAPFLQGFLPKFYIHLSSPTHAPHTPSVSSSSMWLSEYYLVRSTPHDDPQCVISSVLQFLPPS